MDIHHRPDWPEFSWDSSLISGKLAAVRHAHGQLSGELGMMTGPLRQRASLEALTEDIVRSSQIEGERLEPRSVRSSLTRHLGIDLKVRAKADRGVEGIVQVTLDATRNAAQPLTAARLFGWHAALFPTGFSGLKQITTGAWRRGRMEVVSGAYGRERVHFVAPGADRVPQDMERFLTWCNQTSGLDPVLKAAIAHFWFVTIHPFDDGNGRIARAIGDLMLVRAGNTPERWYSLSAQIMRERQAYYAVLEASQSGSLDITAWLDWFLECLGRAMSTARQTLATIRAKARFWQRHAGLALNDRQIKVLNRMLDGFEGKLTSSKWAALAKCSQDTAHRDIASLIAHGILIRGTGGGRSTSYEVVMPDGEAI